MQDQSDSRTSSAFWPTVREELLGPSRPSKRAQFSVAGFALLLIASLVLPQIAETEAMPGISLVALGMLLLLGVAELMDASQRRFVIAVRGSGSAMALLGFALQLA